MRVLIILDWSKEEMDVIKHSFPGDIHISKEACMQLTERLPGRNWQQIKAAAFRTRDAVCQIIVCLVCKTVGLLIPIGIFICFWFRVSLNLSFDLQLGIDDSFW